MFHISGFFDEATTRLAGQLALMDALGVRFLCPRLVDGKNITDFTLEEFNKTLKPRLEAAGVKLSSIGSGIGKIPLEDDEAYQSQLQKLANLAEIAEAAGCRFIRMFSFYMPPGFDEKGVFPRVIEKLQGFLKAVEGHDVTLIHENEKKIFGDTAARALRLHQALASPQFALCHDASNYLQVGEDPWEAYLLTRDATVYYHMKDCQDGFEVPLGQGQGRVRDILADLQARGYDGFLALEPHTAKYALLRRPLRLLPFINAKAARACREVDESRGLSFFSNVTREDVMRWQHENLIKMLDEINSFPSGSNEGGHYG
ncbi:MAG: sugar phosphate isomerase/epimerase [Oscillospiraceae bacterium]|nr:sugar phosphate isomerase/epimerase [Oscillospiraceae bacterium]